MKNTHLLAEGIAYRSTTWELDTEKNIVVKVTHGEALSADNTAAEKFQAGRMREIYDKFSMDIYNMDENGLFYRSR